MAIELGDHGLVRFEPGPFDVHLHPRVTDAMTQDNLDPLNNGTEGKAGLVLYTQAMLRSGITGGIAMPNEQGRLLILGSGLDGKVKTDTVPYPISNIDRMRAMQFAIEQQSVVPLGVFAGLDPEEVYLDLGRKVTNVQGLSQRFAEVSQECLGLKIYGAETTGGFNIATKDIWQVVQLWHEFNQEKPVILHLEDDKVGEVLGQIYELKKGKDIPIHIAHVSSRQELEAVIEAKKLGMNVTCEVTPHHLFLDDSVPSEIGSYGCMKPTLKKQEDIDFLWANIDYIDIIASDCAPHRTSDKEGEGMVYGVTNHSVMLPLLIGAVNQGKLTSEQLYDKLCIKPRMRFNVPLDNSFTTIDMTEKGRDPKKWERFAHPGFGHNAFTRLNRKFHLVGRVVETGAGMSYIHFSKWENSLYGEYRTSYTHLLRPAILACLQEMQEKYWQHEKIKIKKDV